MKKEQRISLVKKVNQSMGRKIHSKLKKKSQMSFFPFFLFIKKGRMMYEHNPSLCGSHVDDEYHFIQVSRCLASFP